MRPWLSLPLLLASSTAAAGGFAVGAQSAEGLGMAGAVSAKPALTSAGFYNPSSAVELEGVAISIGSLLVDAAFEIEDPAGGPTESNRRQASYVPHLHASYARDRFAVVVFSGAPFGSGIEYGDGWRGRHEVTDIALRTFAVNPNVVVRVHPQVSLAAGLQYVQASIEYASRIGIAYDEAGVQLGGDGNGVGVTASATYRPVPQVGLAATYRSRTTIELDGSADFQDVPMPYAARLPDQGVRSRVTLPDRFTLGAHWQATPMVGIAADLEYTNWSTFESLEFDFEDDELDRSVPRNWHDAVAVRVGTEVRLPEGFRARGGFVYDPDVSPSDTLSPTTPDANRYGIAVGGSFAARGLTLDAGYMYLGLAERSSTGEAFPATYRGGAHVAAVTAGYRWSP